MNVEIDGLQKLWVESEGFGLLRTNETAVVADSCMTLFRIAGNDDGPFAPAIRVASMKRISPPEGVTPKPVAMPGYDVRSASSGRYLGEPSTFST